jgi:hypothetical protein
MLTQDLANNVDGGDLGEAVFDASPAHYGGIGVNQSVIGPPYEGDVGLIAIADRIPVTCARGCS